MEQRNPKNVAICLITAQGILCVSRKTNHDDFGLPGGKIEEGETPLDAAKRELKEETGLTFTTDHIKEIYFPEDKVHTATFVIDGFYGEIETDEPHVVMWSKSWEPLFNGSFGDYNKRLYQHLEEIESLWLL